jgi:hypothetical protein
MTVREYINQKNSILLKISGVQLVPDDQIIDVPPMWLYISGDAGICPYCVAYKDICEHCIMHLSGNRCNSGDNTYSKVLAGMQKQDKLRYANICDLPEIQALVKEFNKQFGPTH